MDKREMLSCCYPDKECGNPSLEGYNNAQIFDVIIESVTLMLDRLATKTGFHVELCNLINKRPSTIGNVHEFGGFRGIEFNIRIIRGGTMHTGPVIRIDLCYEPYQEEK